MRTLAAAGLLACLGLSAAEAASDPQAFDLVDRGRYLSILADCDGCHTGANGKPFAGGRPLETPFGTLLAPNITPDRATGIGAWSDDAFDRAVRSGIAPDGAHLYPAMPYPYYARMTREDVQAIRAYLNTVEPVPNAVTSNQLPFPFDIRASMAAWHALYFQPGAFKPVAGKPEAWNRGAYLVEGPGHCGVCHTPKTWLGGDKTSSPLKGGVLLGWFAPDLSADPRLGVGGWSAAELTTYLRTGHNQSAGASGPMAEVVSRSTSQMSDADLAAIASYLKDQPAAAQAAPAAIAASDPVMKQGGAIYHDQCMACHAPDGAGVTGMFPALKASPAVQQSDVTNLARVVLRGAQTVQTDRAPTGPAMPSFDWKLNDDQVAAVLTYVRNSWGNAAAAVDAGKIKSLRQGFAAHRDE